MPHMQPPSRTSAGLQPDLQPVSEPRAVQRRNFKQKGARFEQRASTAFKDAGLDVRSFQRNKDGEADHLITGFPVTFTHECKNFARPRVSEWWAQVDSCTLPGTAPLLTFDLAGEMLSVLRTADLLRLLVRGPSGE